MVRMARPLASRAAEPRAFPAAEKFTVPVGAAEPVAAATCATNSTGRSALGTVAGAVVRVTVVDTADTGELSGLAGEPPLQAVSRQVTASRARVDHRQDLSAFFAGVWKLFNLHNGGFFTIVKKYMPEGLREPPPPPAKVCKIFKA